MKLRTILVISFFVIGLVPLAIANFVTIKRMTEEIARIEETITTDRIRIIKHMIKDWANGIHAKEEIAEAIAGKKTPAGTRDLPSSIFKDEDGHGFAWDLKGNAIIHPFYEGINYKDIDDPEYKKFISHMLETRESQGHIHKTLRDPVSGKNLKYTVKYEYFEPLKLVIGWICRRV